MKTRFCTLAVFLSILCTIPTNDAFPQDPGIRDTVRLENLLTDLAGRLSQGTAILPIRVFNDEYLWSVEIPLKWTGPVTGDSGRFAGEREPHISFGEITMASKGCEIYLTTLPGDPFCPPGDDTLVYLYFSVEDIGYVSFDTASGGPAEFYLHFYDSLLNRIEPYVERPRVYHILPWPPGDVNNNGEVDPGDVVFLINYLFRGGPPPAFLELGDVNGDCAVTGADIVYLINYLFRSGPPPQSGCAFY